MNTGDISNITNASNGLVSLIEKIFPYWGLEGKALDVYLDEISKSDKPPEIKAFEVLNAKQSMKKIKNLKSIYNAASNYVSEQSIQAVSYNDNEDWYDKFFEAAGNISDEKAQIIWGKILAREIEKKGSTPKGIFRILSEIEPSLAHAFNVLCRYSLLFVVISNDNEVIRIIREPIMFDEDKDFYSRKQLDLEVLNELEAIGLIRSSLGIYKQLSEDVSRVLISDGNRTESLILKENHQLPFGVLSFTKAGMYLSDIIDADIADDQMEIMKDYYTKYGLSFEQTDRYSVSLNGKTSVTIMGLRQNK